MASGSDWILENYPGTSDPRSLGDGCKLVITQIFNDCYTKSYVMLFRSSHY